MSKLKPDYSSEFSDVDSEVDFDNKKVALRKDEIYKKPFTNQKLGLFHGGNGQRHKPGSKRIFHDELDKEEGKRQRYHGILAMDAFSRHQKLVNDYLHLYGGKKGDFKRDTSKDKTDNDVLRENHRFLWDEDDSDEEGELSWEQRLAKKYWDKLFKEYAITDLSKFRENKIAFRWRIEKEVVSGKGQFVCGNKRCDEREGLRSWEVNFGYMENNKKKNALVKLRICADCSHMLNYYHKHKEVKCKSKKKKSKKYKKHKREASESKDKNEKAEIVSKDLEKEIWSKPRVVEEEKSREDEFDEYFEDLLL